MDGNSNYPWMYGNTSFTTLLADAQNGQGNHDPNFPSYAFGASPLIDSSDPQPPIPDNINDNVYVDHYGLDHEDSGDEDADGDLTPAARMAIEAASISPAWNIAEEPDPALMNSWQTWNGADPFSGRAELAEGQLFSYFDDMVTKITKCCVLRGKEFKVNTHSANWYVVECMQRDIVGCPWRLSAHKSKLDMWSISKYSSQHAPTCVRDYNKADNRNVIEKFISRDILLIIRGDITLKPRAIIAMMQRDYHVSVTYTRAWGAKQKAIASIYGNWEESYAILPRFLAAVQQHNPGTIVEWSTTTEDEGTERIFERVFWSFAQSIRGFEHCRHVISIDGTHLYGKYKGTLLIAMAVDANEQIFPLAFAIVEGENNSSWHWFMDIIGHRVTQRPGLCVISDRHVGIMKVMKEHERWREPSAFHRICVRHLASNFHSHFRDNILKKLLKSTANTHEASEFEKRMDAIGSKNPQAKKYLEDAGREKWSLAHDGGRRFGMMTTNVSECFNGVMKTFRSLPITAIVKQTFYKTNAYFVPRSAAARMRGEGGHHFSPKIVIAIELNEEIARPGIVTPYGNMRNVYEVEVQRERGYGRQTYVVDLQNMMCNCQRWKNLKLPCPHVLAVCRCYGFDHRSFVDRFYSTECHISTYEAEFHPVGDIQDWPVIEGPIVVPDPKKIRQPGRAGRRRSTRFMNEMDTPTVKGQSHCSLCAQQGHNVRTCPSRASGSGSG